MSNSSSAYRRVRTLRTDPIDHRAITYKNFVSLSTVTSPSDLPGREASTGYTGAMSERAISDVAREVGVSAQTLRVWENQGLLVPLRTTGGQRRYTTDLVERARQIVDLRQRFGWNPSAILNALEGSVDDPPSPTAGSDASPDGLRIRRARQARGLSLIQLASKIDASASHLSAVERGLAPASTRLVAQITDELGIPMSGLAAFHGRDATVVRSEDRASVVLSGGVQWDELVLPGSDLEPALLMVPPGGSSGGSYSRPGQAFAHVLEGELTFRVGGGSDDHVTEGERFDIASGDSISLPARTLYSWENLGETAARAFWVEVLPPHAWADPMTRRIVQAASERA